MNELIVFVEGWSFLWINSYQVLHCGLDMDKVVVFIGFYSPEGSRVLELCIGVYFLVSNH